MPEPIQVDPRDQGFRARASRETARKRAREGGRPGARHMLTNVTEDLVGILGDFRETARSAAPAPYMQQVLTKRQSRRRFENMPPEGKVALAKQLGPLFWDFLDDLGLTGQTPPQE